ncbi:MAG TPA: type 1 glutamine amidotransferase [Candidatus Deferrimicrobium sp.]|nr:type 1 glutamine amidotransferase [Candidatus Deferrimicrobium sp.]
MKPVLIIQNCIAESTGTIRDYFNDRGLPFTVVNSHKDEPFPPVSEVEAVVNLGCPLSVTKYQEHEYLKKLFGYVSQVIREDKPYLGICFGGQMLARVLGAKVAPNHVKEIGTYQVSLTAAGQSDPLFAGFDRSFDVFHWHGDTFNVPFGAELLAEGVDCKNQAFRKGNALAVQFHLEADLPEASRWCDLYKSELAQFGSDKETILVRFQQSAQTIRQLNYRLLDNFFRLTAQAKRPGS